MTISASPFTPPTAVCFARSEFDRLLQLLAQDGYEVIGPVLDDGVVRLQPIASSADLPIGVNDEQGPGRYRSTRTEQQRLFDFVVGPQSWKEFTFRAEQRLWSAERDGDVVRFIDAPTTVQRRAFIGARACDLAAIAVQDRSLRDGRYRDPHYSAERANNFIVAVNCATTASTCFCHGMNTGPRARYGFDIALTELLDDTQHYFFAEAGTAAGAALLQQLDTQPALTAQQHAADAQCAATEQALQNNAAIQTRDIKEFLYDNLEHPHWQNVAARCLSCGNCTAACPTCFCSTTQDLPNLSATESARERVWDSCFNAGHSEVHGAGPLHAGTASRYRQWLTHKLATWIDQFDTSGCVGCGRCITWCPVGIDLRAEIAAMRTSS